MQHPYISSSFQRGNTLASRFHVVGRVTDDPVRLRLESHGRKKMIALLGTPCGGNEPETTGHVNADATVLWHHLRLRQELM